jgi:hypothetical protein
MRLAALAARDHPPTLSPAVDEWLSTLFTPEQRSTPVYKRAPYQRHKDHPEELEPIFNALRTDIPYGGLTALSKMAHISDATLFQWKKNLQENPFWRPRREAYGKSRCAMPREAELILAGRIIKTYLDPGLFFCDQDFRLEALQFYKELQSGKLTKLLGHTPDDRFVPDRPSARPLHAKFACSRHYTQDFRRRHQLALRRPALKRRRNVTQQQIDEFIARVDGLMREYPLTRIVNMDETHWKAVAAGFLTWAEKGAESVTCYISNDEKDGVTVIAAIDAAGNKLPLTVVGKGKTPRCLGSYCLPPAVWGLVSESGWTTTQVMVQWLSALRQNLFPDDRPVAVILDTYAAHRCQEVRTAASNLNIELIFIPPGCTDLLQPLDRRVFGVLKSKARRRWRSRYHSRVGGRATHAELIDDLLSSWHELTEDAIVSAWSVYDSPNGVWSADDDELDRGDDGEFRPYEEPDVPISTAELLAGMAE